MPGSESAPQSAPQSGAEPAPQPAAQSAPPADVQPSLGSTPDDTQYQDPYLDELAYFTPQPEEELMSWQGLSRPFKKRNRKYFSSVFTIVLLISLILFFAGQVPTLAVVIAVAFVAYVLAAIPPQEVTYRITTYGVRIEGQLYYWEELGRFWFSNKLDHRIITIEVARFPDRITLVLRPDVDEKLIQELLSIVLLQEKPARTYYERAGEWLQEKIPLDLEA